MRNRKVRILVELQLPEYATVQMAEDYVEEAVGSWHGSLQPPFVDGGGNVTTELVGDPMFELDGRTVRARYSRTTFDRRKKATESVA